MQTLLIFGGSSRLALNWAFHLRNNLNVIIVCQRNIVKLPGVKTVTSGVDSQIDVTELILRLQPDWILNCIGMTNVDACEQDYDLAFYINCKIPSLLAQCCRRTETPLIHISTDHLFSGTSQYYSESSEVAPINNYAKTKLLGERAVTIEQPNSLILRTNFYGWGPKYRPSSSDKILFFLRNGQAVDLFADIFYTPVLSSLVADIGMELIRSSNYGLYNIASNERVSKFEFGKLLASIFDLDSTLIRPTLASSTAPLARRPQDMSLSNSKVKSVVRLPVMAISEQISTLRRQEAALTHCFNNL